MRFLPEKLMAQFRVSKRHSSRILNNMLILPGTSDARKRQFEATINVNGPLAPLHPARNLQMQQRLGLYTYTPFVFLFRVIR